MYIIDKYDCWFLFSKLVVGRITIYIERRTNLIIGFEPSRSLNVFTSLSFSAIT